MFRSLSSALIFFALAFNSNAQTKVFSILNPSNAERTDELIILKRNELQNHLGTITEKKVISISDKKNDPVIVQLDDINSDGKWDEAAFLYSFKPKEVAQFKIKVSDMAAKDAVVQRAHVRLRKKNNNESFGPYIKKEIMPYQNPATDFSKEHLPIYLTEGPAWENDKVAFRQYFDVRNTRDIYGKTTAQMMMDTVGADYKNSYHELSFWGMDILHVGKSLGAGSVAFEITDRNKNDTLIRLGGENIKREAYRQIADGPLRAIFKITYKWSLNNKPVTINEITSIWGGQYFYETKFYIDDAPPGSNLVTGIADFFENTSDNFETANAAVLLSHGRQSENKDYLGLGIVVRKKDFASFGKTPDKNAAILNTYFVAQHIKNNTSLTYRFYSCWEKTDNRFASKNYFEDYMKEEAVKFSNPLQIKW